MNVIAAAGPAVRFKSAGSRTEAGQACL